MQLPTVSRSGHPVPQPNSNFATSVPTPAEGQVAVVHVSHAQQASPDVDVRRLWSDIGSVLDDFNAMSDGSAAAGPAQVITGLIAEIMRVTDEITRVSMLTTLETGLKGTSIPALSALGEIARLRTQEISANIDAVGLLLVEGCDVENAKWAIRALIDSIASRPSDQQIELCVSFLGKLPTLLLRPLVDGTLSGLRSLLAPEAVPFVKLCRHYIVGQRVKYAGIPDSEVFTRRMKDEFTELVDLLNCVSLETPRIRRHVSLRVGDLVREIQNHAAARGERSSDDLLVPELARLLAQVRDSNPHEATKSAMSALLNEEPLKAAFAAASAPARRDAAMQQLLLRISVFLERIKATTDPEKQWGLPFLGTDLPQLINEIVRTADADRLLDVLDQRLKNFLRNWPNAPMHAFVLEAVKVYFKRLENVDDLLVRQTDFLVEHARKMDSNMRRSFALDLHTAILKETKDSNLVMSNFLDALRWIRKNRGVGDEFQELLFPGTAV